MLCTENILLENYLNMTKEIKITRLYLKAFYMLIDGKPANFRKTRILHICWKSYSDIVKQKNI